ncbi:MAG: IS3 family transposase [Burkholderiaceae bacterium]
MPVDECRHDLKRRSTSACAENALASFFATLKAEYFYLSAFEDVEQLDAGLKSYIDYYNQRRIKSKLSGMSPVEYRLQAARN